MNIEDQVCSLELAKRLKELGVEQKSYFAYEERENGYLEIFHSKATSCANKYYSAFTVAELGEILPSTIKKNTNLFYITMDCDKCPYYEDMPKTKEIYSEMGEENDTEADARAKMLIYLIENGLLIR